ncbi:hypothetical protein ACS0TY_017629 [Phlomoides rotata]
MASSKRQMFLLGLIIGYVFLITSNVAATQDQPRVSLEIDKKRGSDRRLSFGRIRPPCRTWSRGSGCG